MIGTRRKASGTGQEWKQSTLCDGGRVWFLIIRGCAATRVLIWLSVARELVHSCLHLRSSVVDLWIHNLRNNSVNTRLQHSWSETQDNLQKSEEKTKTKIKVVLNSLLLSKLYQLHICSLTAFSPFSLDYKKEYTTENEVHTTLAFSRILKKKLHEICHISTASSGDTKTDRAKAKQNAFRTRQSPVSTKARLVGGLILPQSCPWQTAINDH